ncbi:glutamate 5-kinase [Listeria costaricensis]|uniref:glutamate 5-kinase n=1 Tax=Listeria costaricensis TaxID=2026604 RepID=UPI000C072AD6|nr:glutamate 5-kinase [Listeria costaricensis]
MRKDLKNCKRIVVKVGTSTLMYPNGNINLRTIEKLAQVLAELRNEGREVVLVSSGAIGVGCRKLRIDKRPTTIPEQQAIAAVGQNELMHIYSKFFGEYGYPVGQVLLTRDVIDYPTSRKNVMNTLETLIQQGIIPIVNENDTVAVEEIEHITKFGDNDRLSAIVAKLVDASLLIMLSDINGFYESDPSINPLAEMFDEIHAITPEIEQLAGGKGSEFGTGGMLTKLAAADYCLRSERMMLLTNGQDPAVIFDILNGQRIGTLFAAEFQKEMEDIRNV